MKAWKVSLALLSFLVLVSILYLGYFCSDANCALTKSKERAPPDYKSTVEMYKLGRVPQSTFEEEDIVRKFEVDLEDEDVIVFLHMQKTGGTTFGKHLVRNLDVDSPCECRGKKRCDCLTKRKTVWLFSRYSTGWMCGLHADWTELKSCVDSAMDKREGRHRNRRFYYITILRDPVHRYISEWMHVQRGATWKTALLKCNGRSATLEEVPFCYRGSSWTGVTLQEFLNCPHNLANNRQTRMLANLSKVNCYNTSGVSAAERDEMMLESAKENLRDMAYFGLTEFQNYTQFLFESTFGIKFIRDFQQYNKTHSSAIKSKVTEEQQQQVMRLNALDVRLYHYAKDLFFQRVERALEESMDSSKKITSVGGPDNFEETDKDEDPSEEKKGEITVMDMRDDDVGETEETKAFDQPES